MTLFKDFSPTYYPKGSMTQDFGENFPLYREAFGMDGHNGKDFVAPWGTPLFPFKAGKVVEVKNSETGYGKYIRILTDEVNGVCEEWTYGHMSKIIVVLGQRIETNECFGEMGNTGFVVSGSTPFWKYNPYAGTHVHVGKRLVKMFKKAHKTWTISYGTGEKGTILGYENGFKGSVNYTLDEGEDIRQKQLTVISLANQVIVLYRQLINILSLKE